MTLTSFSNAFGEVLEIRSKCLKNGRMDDLRFYVLFNSISVIS